MSPWGLSETWGMGMDLGNQRADGHKQNFGPHDFDPWCYDYEDVTYLSDGIKATNKVTLR